MRKIYILNATRPEIHPFTVIYCDSFLCRLRSLTFRRQLAPDEGLLLVESHESRLASAIHMLGVWFELGVIWINARGLVVDKVLARPWRANYVPCCAAQFVLEVAPARLEEFLVGDEIKFEKAGMD
jgi:uncharacterized membrane protein (UPF0127 family)